jgi:prepilin-type N-terminal cleavage/methylation domain-containing protein
MNNHRGFTLIEILVALACIVGVLSVTIQVTMKLYRSWGDTTRTVQTRVALHAALDTLRRDLEQAVQERTQWQVTSPHEIIWHDTLSGKALRLCVVKGRLERFEGSYDERTRQWHTRSTSVLAQDIQEIRCTLHASNVWGSSARYNAITLELSALTGIQESVLIAIGVGALS